MAGRRCAAAPPRAYQLKLTAVPASPNGNAEPNLYPAAGDDDNEPTDVFPNVADMLKGAKGTIVKITVSR